MLNSKLCTYLYKISNRSYCNSYSTREKTFYYTNILYYPFIRELKRKAYKDNPQFSFVDKSYVFCAEMVEYVDLYIS